MQLKQKIKLTKQKTLNQRAIEKFNTCGEYVSQIVSGKRKAVRGKAKLIREFLESETEKSMKISNKN